MLIIGDIHGNYEKAKAFLDYKPEEEHCFVGDYTDSFIASNEDIIKTMQLIFDSNAIVLSGNHDNQYYKNSGMFTLCSGYRHAYAAMFVDMFEKYKHRIQASCIADDFFVCHGGVTKEFGAGFETIKQMNHFCNSEFNLFKNSVMPWENGPSIFYIGGFRGGDNQYSGIFWATMQYEQFDERFNIVCGHTHKREPRIELFQDKMHVCVDCPKYVCFNTKTKHLEDFFPVGKNRDQLEIKY